MVIVTMMASFFARLTLNPLLTICNYDLSRRCQFEDNDKFNGTISFYSIFANFVA